MARRRNKIPIDFLAGLAAFILVWGALCYWLGLYLIVYIVLYTATLVFIAQTENFVRARWLRTRIATLFHLSIFVCVLVSNYWISTIVLVSLVGISFILHTLVRVNLRTYAFFLGKDWFKSSHWIKKSKDHIAWKRIIPLLLKKNYYYSLSEILREYIKTIDKDIRLHLRDAIFEMWDQCYKEKFIIRILDLEDKRSLSFTHLLHLICNFELMLWWLKLQEKRPKHQEILHQFFLRFNNELTKYLQAPYRLNFPTVKDQELSKQIDLFINNFPQQSEELQEQIHYAYSMLYVVNGIAKNF
ncbi:MAG: hypothetical protein MK212_19470 [Saprospiraceae bacterium]|nr:hypothetical protein [Saprospiraceae bacterium]